MDYLKQDEAEIPSDLYTEPKVLTHISPKMFEMYPVKKKDFGMTWEENITKKYEGLKEKTKMMNNLTPPPTLQENLFLNSYTTTFHKSSLGEYEKNLLEKRKINADIKTNNLISYMDNIVNFEILYKVFGDDDKFLSGLNSYMIYMVERLRKEKGLDDEEEIIPIQTIENRKFKEFIPMRSNVEGIISYDLETDTKVYCDWSGANVLTSFDFPENYGKNNEYIQKLINIDVILWKEGYLF